MDDRQIIELYNERSEAAISKTAEKYGRYCHYIAYNILHNEEDSEECVNETYFRAWNMIPPQIPNNLPAFLGKITRNLALDKYKYAKREKRGGTSAILAIDELEECIPAANDIEKSICDKELIEALNTFLGGLSTKKRQIFVRRYWYLSSISEIARDYEISENNAKVILLRTRKELKVFLEKEGIQL